MIRSAGERAPEFELMDDEGNLRKLSDYRANHCAYFYPAQYARMHEACSFGMHGRLFAGGC